MEPQYQRFLLFLYDYTSRDVLRCFCVLFSDSSDDSESERSSSDDETASGRRRRAEANAARKRGAHRGFVSRQPSAQAGAYFVTITIMSENF